MDKRSRVYSPSEQEGEVAGHSSEVGMSTVFCSLSPAYLVQETSTEIGVVHTEHGLSSSFIFF